MNPYHAIRQLINAGRELARQGFGTYSFKEGKLDVRVHVDRIFVRFSSLRALHLARKNARSHETVAVSGQDQTRK